MPLYVCSFASGVRGGRGFFGCVQMNVPRALSWLQVRVRAQQVRVYLVLDRLVRLVKIGGR